jgi:hypothetical protein
MIVESQQQRRFSDQVCAVFHEACDEGDVALAEVLLQQMAPIIREPLRLPSGLDRRRPERLTAPAERLMNLVLWRMQPVDAEPLQAR